MTPLAALLIAASVPVGDGPEPHPCLDARPALFTSAQRAHRVGDFELALEDASLLAQCFPDNVDYLYQQALALAALGRTAEAAEIAARAATWAPKYEELVAFANRLEAQTAAQAPNAEDDLEVPAPEPQRAPVRWLANAWVAAHELTGGRDGWNDLAVGLRRSQGDLSLGGFLEGARRGDANDLTITGDALWTVRRGTRVSARLGLTPDATFRPEVLAAFGAEHDLAGGWVLRGELAQRRFDRTKADNVTLGADYYFSSFRFAGGVTVSRLSGAGTSLGTVASLDWYANETNRYRVTASLGDELDTIEANNTVLETRVKSLTLAGEHAVSRGLSLGWWVGTIEQGDFYDRRYAGLSVTRRY
ncbi:MAG: YaiO family outer membrane beta-barrel protein [Pseudomonadota bacterium]